MRPEADEDRQPEAEGRRSARVATPEIEAIEIELGEAGALRVDAACRLLALAARLEQAGRYLPIDAPRPSSSLIEALRWPWPGPRGLGYGSASRWLEGVTLADGRTLSKTDGATRGDLETTLLEEDVASVSLKTLALPSASRTLLGRFRDADALRRALAPLAAERPDALVAAELCDRVAARWLIGRDPGQPFSLILQAEGDAEATVLAWRKAWQSIELAGGQPDTMPVGLWRWGALAPDGGPPTRCLRLADAPDALAGWMETLAELRPLLGGTAIRAQVLLGQLWVWLPAGPRLEEALTWLRARAAEAGTPLEPIEA